MKIKDIHYAVAQLIESLKQFPQNLPVLVRGYENDLKISLSLKKTTLQHKADNPYWDGEFQEAGLMMKEAGGRF